MAMKGAMWAVAAAVLMACVCASMVASDPAVSGGQIYFSSDDSASAGSAYAEAHDQLSLIESEEAEHELRAAAAQLQAQAEAAAMMAPHSDALIESMAPGMAVHSAAAAPSEAEAAQAALDGDSLSPEQAALLEAAAFAPADEEEQRMTSVFHPEQFEDFAGDDQFALVDSESEVRARVDARINAQVEAEMRAYANSRGQAEAESASHAELSQAMQSAAVQAHAAAADAELDAQAEADLSEEEYEERQNRAAQQAAMSLEASFTSEMEYPSLVETAATSRSTGLVAAEAEAESSVEPSNLPSGVAHTKERALGMQKLRSRIAAAAAAGANKDHVVPTRAHSFIASKSATHARSRAKSGDQWWLEKAPWFLPPPPEWGPMPVTMYTSYFHRPTASAQHLDYAHGIPLPHAEALGVARRTYPQPPFEAQQEAEVAFMEVASEQHAETGAEAEAEVEAETETETELDAESESESDAESDAESESESDAESDAELDAESEVEVELEDFDPSLMELASDAETETETEVAADAETEAEAEAETDAEAQAETAVEAEAVDDLAQASPLSGEEYFSAPM